MGNDKITVIIPIYNSIKHLKTCLDSVCAAIDRYGNAELILVDNGSTDGSYELAREDYGRKAKVHQIEDATIAALRNHGARGASGEYLSFIDSDFAIPQDYFRQGLALFSKLACVGLVCKLELPPSPNWIEETWWRLHWRARDGYVPLYGGTCIIKRTAFEKVGGFKEALLTDEDWELGVRLAAAGLRIYESSGLTGVHLGEPGNAGEFFRRHIWHGLGMLRDLKSVWRNKPLLMTVAHFALSVIGAASLLLPWGDLLKRVAVFVLFSAFAPGVTVLVRWARIRKVYRPLRSFLLYYLYFSARVLALLKLISMRGRPHKRPQEHSPRT